MCLTMKSEQPLRIKKAAMYKNNELVIIIV
jgi:hypothetical protein